MRCVRRAMFSLACRFRSYLLLLFGCIVLALSICVCLGIQENMETVSEQMAAYYGGRIEVFCSEKLLENGVMLCGFHYDNAENRICAQPMCIIPDSENAVVRLLY